MIRGTLTQGVGGLYFARTPEGEEYPLRAKKKFRRQGLTPLVGDEVLFTPGMGEEHGWLEEILPRKSECLRPRVANLTRMCVVTAVRPLPDWLLVDKMLYYARREGIGAVIAVNKCDLDGGGCAREAARMYKNAEAAVLPVSAATGEGLDEMRAALQNETTCFLGQSGVGKSTLLNRLFALGQETGDISRKIERGKNTTRHARMFFPNGLRVLDTPGFSLLDIEDVFEPVELRAYYPEFAPYEGQCRFSPCCHDSEPGCAVRRAVEAGEIDGERYGRYRILLENMRKNWRERYD